MADVVNRRVQIFIDSAAAEDAFQRLQAKTDVFSTKIAKARQEQEKLKQKIEEGKKAGENVDALEQKYTELGTRINNLNSQLKKNKEAQDTIKEQIDKGLSPSFNQLERYVTSLRNQLKNMSQDVPGYAEKFDSFKKASEQLNNLRGEFSSVEKAQKSWMQEAKTVAFGVVVGNTVTSVAESIGGYLSGIVTGNAKLSDSLSDIEKSTGLSAESVAKLNSELKKIDTRTQAADLREIAVGLGQIGEAANKENVAAIDQIVVALGDEFGGGAKEITTTLSVLRNNLQDIKTGNYGDDVGKIGNALNTLGSEGLATAPVVTDIANRIAGISQTFGVSSGQILGLAATFQELGIETERGATAVTKIFQKIGSEPEKFAKVTKLSAKDFKELVNKDMLAAFQLVAEGAQKAGSNNIVFSKILKELDADGSGAGEVLSKLGKNHELLASKVGIATEALKSNSSITEEFNKKNNNLAAQLEKLKKDFESFIQSRSLADFFAASVSGLRNFIAVLKEVPNWLKENQTAIYLIVAGLALMNAAYLKSGYALALNTAETIKNTVVTKAKNAWDVISIASQSALIVVTNLLTGKITAATAAQRLWAITMSVGLGPIGLLVVAIGALAIALNAIPESYTGAQKAAQDFAEIQANANKSLVDEKVNLSALLSIAQDETKSKQERKKAIDAINAQMPEYIQKLTLENVTTKQGADIINQYIEVLGKKALAQAYMSKLQELYNKQIEVENSSIQDNVGWYEKLYNVLTSGGVLSASVIGNVETGTKNRKESITAIKDEIKVLKEKFDQDVKNGKALLEIPGAKKGTGNKSNDPAVNPFGDAEDKKGKALLEKLKAFKLELEQVGKTQDESEIARITNKYNTLIKEATKFGIKTLELETEKNRAIAFLQDKAAKEQEAKRKKQFEDDTASEYENQQKLTADFFERKKQSEAQRYANGEVDKKQYEINIGLIDLEGKRQQLQNAEDYSGVVKKAEADLLVFKKNITKEEIDDAIRKREKLVENEKLLADFKRQAALTDAKNKVALSPEGSKEQLEAKKALAKLELQFELEDLEQKRKSLIAAVTERNKQELELLIQQMEAKRKLELATISDDDPEAEKKKKAINNRYDTAINSARVESAKKTANELVSVNDTINKLIQGANSLFKQKDGESDMAYWTGKINQVLGFVQQALGILDQFNQTQTARENAELDRQMKANDKRRRSNDALAKAKSISEIEARKRNAALDAEDEKRKEELTKKQNERNKKIAIAQAVVNGALAITSILAAPTIDPTGILKGIQIAFAIATTAAQIAVIASQKFADGGKVLPNGKITATPNIPTQPNGDNVLATVRTDEVILNKKQQAALGGDATFAAIGVPGFAKGGKVVPIWKNRPYQSFDYAKVIQQQIVVKAFATGGLVGNATPKANTDNNNAITSLLQRNEQAIQYNADALNRNADVMNALLGKLEQGITTSVSLKQLDDAYDMRATIREEAGAA